MTKQTPNRLLGAMLCASLIAAGCAGAPDDADDQDPDPTDPNGPDQNRTAMNLPPLASLIVLFNSTQLIIENGSYDVIAGDNLTLDASGSSDPEGGNLTYVWDLGNETGAKGINVTHAFAAGVWVVGLTVTDDEGATGSANATINATAGGGLLFFDDFETNQGWTTSGDGPAASPGWHAVSDAFSPSTAWTHSDDRIGGYYNEETQILTSPAFDSSAASTLSLAFVFKGGSESTFDFLHVEVSDGSSWKELAAIDGAHDEWESLNLDASVVAGNNAAQLRFRFVSDMLCSAVDHAALCNTETVTGYWIDDVSLVG